MSSRALILLLIPVLLMDQAAAAFAPLSSNLMFHAPITVENRYFQNQALSLVSAASPRRSLDKPTIQLSRRLSELVRSLLRMPRWVPRAASLLLLSPLASFAATFKVVSTTIIATKEFTVTQPQIEIQFNSFDHMKNGAMVAGDRLPEVLRQLPDWLKFQDPPVKLAHLPSAREIVSGNMGIDFSHIHNVTTLQGPVAVPQISMAKIMPHIDMHQVVVWNDAAVWQTIISDVIIGAMILGVAYVVLKYLYSHRARMAKAARTLLRTTIRVFWDLPRLAGQLPASIGRLLSGPRNVGRALKRVYFPDASAGQAIASLIGIAGIAASMIWLSAAWAKPLTVILLLGIVLLLQDQTRTKMRSTRLAFGWLLLSREGLSIDKQSRIVALLSPRQALSAYGRVLTGYARVRAGPMYRRLKPLRLWIRFRRIRLRRLSLRAFSEPPLNVPSTITVPEIPTTAQKAALAESAPERSITTITKDAPLSRINWRLDLKGFILNVFGLLRRITAYGWGIRIAVVAPLLIAGSPWHLDHEVILRLIDGVGTGTLILGMAIAGVFLITAPILISAMLVVGIAAKLDSELAAAVNARTEPYMEPARNLIKDAVGSASHGLRLAGQNFVDIARAALSLSTALGRQGVRLAVWVGSWHLWPALNPVRHWTRLIASPGWQRSAPLRGLLGALAVLGGSVASAYFMSRTYPAEMSFGLVGTLLAFPLIQPFARWADEWSAARLDHIDAPYAILRATASNYLSMVHDEKDRDRPMDPTVPAVAKALQAETIHQFWRKYRWHLDDFGYTSELEIAFAIERLETASLRSILKACPNNDAARAVFAALTRADHPALQFLGNEVATERALREHAILDVDGETLLLDHPGQEMARAFFILLMLPHENRFNNNSLHVEDVAAMLASPTDQTISNGRRYSRYEAWVQPFIHYHATANGSLQEKYATPDEATDALQTLRISLPVITGEPYSVRRRLIRNFSNQVKETRVLLSDEIPWYSGRSSPSWRLERPAGTRDFAAQAAVAEASLWVRWPYLALHALGKGIAAPAAAKVKIWKLGWQAAASLVVSLVLGFYAQERLTELHLHDLHLISQGS